MSVWIIGFISLWLSEIECDNFDWATSSHTPYMVFGHLYMPHTTNLSIQGRWMYFEWVERKMRIVAIVTASERCVNSCGLTHNKDTIKSKNYFPTFFNSILPDGFLLSNNVSYWSQNIESFLIASNIIEGHQTGVVAELSDRSNFFLSGACIEASALGARVNNILLVHFPLCSFLPCSRAGRHVIASLEIPISFTRIFRRYIWML